MGLVMIKTKHAQLRMQQRGIPESALQLLLRYGKYQHDGHGAEIVTFNKAARNCLKKHETHACYVRAERHFDVYSVITDEVIITIGHRKQRFYI